MSAWRGSKTPRLWECKENGATGWPGGLGVPPGRKGQMEQQRADVNDTAASPGDDEQVDSPSRSEVASHARCNSDTGVGS